MTSSSFMYPPTLYTAGLPFDQQLHQQPITRHPQPRHPQTAPHTSHSHPQSQPHSYPYSQIPPSQQQQQQQQQPPAPPHHLPLHQHQQPQRFHPLSPPQHLPPSHSSSQLSFPQQPSQLSSFAPMKQGKHPAGPIQYPVAWLPTSYPYNPIQFSPPNLGGVYPDPTAPPAFDFLPFGAAPPTVARSVSSYKNPSPSSSSSSSLLSSSSTLSSPAPGSFVLPAEKDVMLLSDDEARLGSYSFADPRFTSSSFVFVDSSAKFYQQHPETSEYDESSSSSSPLQSVLSHGYDGRKSSSLGIEEQEDEDEEDENADYKVEAVGIRSPCTSESEDGDDSGSDYEECGGVKKPAPCFASTSITTSTSTSTSTSSSKAGKLPSANAAGSHRGASQKNANAPAKVPKRRGPVPSYIVYAESIAAHTKQRELEFQAKQAAAAAASAGTSNAGDAEEVKKEPECANCGTKNTSLWRRGRDNECLCNPCGLYYRLHNVTRPLELKTDVIKKRNRGDCRSSSKKKRAGSRKKDH